MSKNEDAITLLNAGTKLASAAGAGVVSIAITALAGPSNVGAAIVLGSITSKSIEILGDMAQRHLSDRERSRVGAVASFAISNIANRLDTGELPRADQFMFSSNGRSDADELFEGILIKAKNEHEEKKAPYIANVYSNIVFNDQIHIAEANHYLRIASNLTYRQLCILSLLSNQEAVSKLRNNDYTDVEGKVGAMQGSLLQEIFETNQTGLMTMQAPGFSSMDAVLDFTGILPSEMLLTQLGNRLYEVMGLKSIPREDITPIENMLRQ